MDKKREEQIAARAYQLWEQEGRPHGAHERHWDQASREVEAAARKKSGRAGMRTPAERATGTAGRAKSAVAKSAAKPKVAAAATPGPTKRGAKPAAARKPIT